ncbi:TPA: hypothetical protein JBA38_09450 [Legionella pneumophila]|uniref:hypothetical protein n=1 Tax=Legionella pneumophila TaxID=446 RepID=UPI0013752C8E|nr:hypothetical protein [Legionella pneumophila]HAT8751908.1 hypothetical protein [Legionella pneumophila]
MISNDTVNELIERDKRKNVKLSDFIITNAKPGGSRWGYIGHFGNSELFLLKREHLGYETISSSTPNCITILECLCSKIIGKVLGKHYVAETIPVKIDTETIKIHQGNETESLQLDEYDDYAIASRWLSNQQMNYDVPSIDHTINDDYMLKFALMCNLLGINDVKSEHYIKHTVLENGILHQHMAIIDCAGDLSAFEQEKIDYFFKKNMYIGLLRPIVSAKPEQYPLVLEVFTEFLKIDVDKEFEEYEHIPSPSLEQMKVNLQKTLDLVRDSLLPQLVTLIEVTTEQNSKSIPYSISFYKPGPTVEEKTLRTLTPTTINLN